MPPTGRRPTVVIRSALPVPLFLLSLSYDWRPLSPFLPPLNDCNPTRRHPSPLSPPSPSKATRRHRPHGVCSWLPERLDSFFYLQSD